MTVASVVARYSPSTLVSSRSSVSAARTKDCEATEHTPDVLAYVRLTATSTPTPEPYFTLLTILTTLTDCTVSIRDVELGITRPERATTSATAAAPAEGYKAGFVREPQEHAKATHVDESGH